MIVFESPSPSAYYSRRIFHACQRDTTENIVEWLNRIKEPMGNCDFGVMNDFMLIDKFLSGLNSNDFKQFSQHTIRSEEQLFTFVKENKPFFHIDFEDTIVVANLLPCRLQGGEIKDEITNEYDNDNFVNVNVNADRTMYNFEGESDERYCFENDFAKDTNDVDANDKSGVDGETEAHQERIVIESIESYLDDASNGSCVGDKQKNAKKDEQPQSFFCHICVIDCLCRSKYDVHMRKHIHLGKSFECYLCSMQYSRLLGLKVHFSRMHVRSKKKRLSCTECDKTFLERVTLERHIKIHKGLAESYKCPHCNKEFELRCRMLAHLARYTETKEEHICEICGQIYRTRKLLNVHRRTHSEMRYKCQVCGLLLKNNNTYRIHQRQHTGERPHQCKLCPKSFVTAPSYKKHLMVHNKIKPHACTVCSGRFATPYHLKMHMNRHTGDKPYKCTQCDARFSQPPSLNTHMRRFHQKMAAQPN